MPQLAISLLGSFNVILNGNSRSIFATDKVRALLAYLAIESERPHRRLALAALFWPDRPEAFARNDLRQALFQLHKALECRDDKKFLILSTEDVQVNPACDHWLDVDEFNTLISACRSHHPDGLDLCETCRERLERVVALYQGEFLEGFSLPGCLNFDMWQAWTQEICHIRVMEALTYLANYYESLKRYDQVLEYSQRKIEIEPWHESAYRRIMRVLALKGQIGQAIQQYEACREILKHEFGIPPSQETIQLLEQIKEGRLDESSQPALSNSADESNNRLMLDSFPQLLFSGENDGDQSMRDSLRVLALEIHKLHAGRVLSADHLHRLRKGLSDAINALETVSNNNCGS